MDNKKNILIFGAGDCGRRHYQLMDDNVLCFIDNDIQKQGTEIYKKLVIAPDKIKEFKYDYIVIASIFESEIRHQLIMMGLEDKLMLSTTIQNKSTIVKPVNYVLPDFSKEKIISDAQYSFEIAISYINNLKDIDCSIVNKSILEIGPGINLGTSLILICLGAKKVTVCDRFLVQFSNKYHTELYKQIIKLLNANFKNIDCSPLLESIENKSHNVSRLYATQLPLEKIGINYPLAFDITLSNAVLEHLYNPLQALISLYQCMSSDGVGSHQVDFRDHRDFNKPLEFLLLDDLSFHSIMHEASCECGNRVRAFQMYEMIKEIGFKYISLKTNMVADKQYFENFLERLKAVRYSSFSAIDPTLLNVLSACLLIKKNE